jgi:hypothetical protein
MLDELIWKCFWCIVKKIDKNLNEYNEYGVPKKKFKQWPMFFIIKMTFWKMWNDLKMTFIWENFMYTFTL